MHPGEGTPPSYALVPAQQGSTLVSSFFNTVLIALPGENAAGRTQEKPCALSLEVKEDVDVISINAFLYFGALKNNFVDLDKYPRQSLGIYSAGLDETVVLEEMRKFGLQPYTIKVLTAQVPLSGTPVLSEVPSLQIAIESEDRTSYKVVIHNSSAQAVTGFVVERRAQYARSGARGYDDGKPMIAPRADYKFSMANNDLGCTSPDDSASPHVPCPIVLKGALFADGTRTGDSAILAGLEVSRLKTSAPREQLRTLIWNTVNDPSMSDTEKIVKLRVEIPKLPEHSDPAALDPIRSYYPDLSDTEWDQIKAQNDNLPADKQIVLQELDAYEDSSPASMSVDSLAQWLRHWGWVD
jgi:hypothetical protein